MLLMLDDRVAIRPLSDPDKIGSIYIPETAKRRSDQGIVIYRGPNVEEIKVGDHVLFPAYSGNKVTVVGEGMYIIMPESEIVAVLGEGERVFTQREIEKFLDRAWDVEGNGTIESFIHSIMDQITNAEVRELEL